jgi:hypothetical protein
VHAADGSKKIQTKQNKKSSKQHAERENKQQKIFICGNETNKYI